MAKSIQVRYQPKDFNHVKDLVAMVTGHKKADASMHLEETFYNAPNGVLKFVQKGKETKGDLVFEGKDGNATLPLASPKEFLDFLAKSNGVKGKLSLTQHTFKSKDVTVFADKVDGVGDYVVLRVDLKEGQTADEAEEILKDYVQKLDMVDAPKVEGEYVDLVLKKK